MALTGFDKAIAAAIVAAAGAIVAAAAGGHELGAPEYIAAAVTGILAGLAVYFKRNLPVTP